MKPPWLEFPDLPRGCMGWRMNGGEDYMDDWIRWYRGLMSQKRKEYRDRYPEPEGWRGFYKQFPL